MPRDDSPSRRSRYPRMSEEPESGIPSWAFPGIGAVVVFAVLVLICIGLLNPRERKPTEAGTGANADELAALQKQAEGWRLKRQAAAKPPVEEKPEVPEISAVQLWRSSLSLGGKRVRASGMGYKDPSYDGSIAFVFEDSGLKIARAHIPKGNWSLLKPVLDKKEQDTPPFLRDRFGRVELPSHWVTIEGVVGETPASGQAVLREAKVVAVKELSFTK